MYNIYDLIIIDGINKMGSCLSTFDKNIIKELPNLPKDLLNIVYQYQKKLKKNHKYNAYKNASC